MQYFIGLDDTDNLESRGTGHLARTMATARRKISACMASRATNCWKMSACRKLLKTAALQFSWKALPYPLIEIAMYARKVLLDDFQPGSDPGLCVAADVPAEIIAYGQRAQCEFLYQQEPRDLAAAHGLHLEGLGGDEDGVIGALAAVGLAASGGDGRYVQVGSIRDLEGLLPLANVLAAGITSVKTLDGETVTEGMILSDKLRPARRGGQPVLFVEREDDHWLPLKLD